MIQDAYNIQRNILIKCNIPLNEARGIGDSMVPLINFLWDKVNHAEVLTQDNYHVISLNNIDINNEWLYNISSLTVEWGDNRAKDSYFNAFNDNCGLNGNNQLTNVKLHISLNNLTQIEFSSELMHELQHAYRHRFFLMKNDNDITKEKDRIISLLPTQTDGYSKRIQLAYYLSDKDEIAARASSLYTIIIQNDNITRDNYESEIESTDAIQALNGINEALTLFSASHSNKIKTLLGQLVIQTISTFTEEINPIQVFNLFRRRLINAIGSIESQNYKVISKALHDAEQANPSRKPKGVRLEELKEYDTYFDVDKYVKQLEQIEKIREMIKKLG